MSSKGSYLTAAAVGAGIAGVCYSAYCVYQERSKPKLPMSWTHVGTLKDLYAYPIKSCGPVILEKAECSLLGLRDNWLRDRILMVVDEKNNFISARAFPVMLTVRPTVEGSVLTLKQPDMEPLSVDLAEVAAAQKSFTACVWSVPVPVYDCGWEASEWFSRLLQRTTHSLRLVHYAVQGARQLRGNTNKIYKFTKNDSGAFPDEVSFNLINQSSVDDLNGRLDNKVTPNRFRPNFVLQGAEPYAEDEWNYIKIGENVFEIIKPCVRCIMTTIDPETGIRDSRTEPLNTLKSYRQLESPAERRSAGNSPRMGVQMALRSGPGGLVALSDNIYVA